MKNISKISLIILLSILVSTISCKKPEKVKLDGIYDCTVEYSYWDMTPTKIDSTYLETIEIKQEGENLRIIGEVVPLESVKNGQEFKSGHGQNSFSVSFKNKQVFIFKTVGGLGGGSGWKYTGNKR